MQTTSSGICFANVTLDEASTDSVVIININGQAVKDSWNKIKVVMNSTKDAATVTGIDGMTKVADGYTVGDTVDQNSSAAPQAMSIWVKEADESESQFTSMEVRGITSWNEGDAMILKDGKWVSQTYDLQEGTEFKIVTNGTGWGNDDNIYGDCSNNKTLASVTSGCGDNAKSDKAGKYQIYVDEQTMTWELVAVQ